MKSPKNLNLRKTNFYEFKNKKTSFFHRHIGMSAYLHISVFLLSAFCFQFSYSQSNDSLRKINNEAFSEGEFLKYRIHYGWITAGEATLEIQKENYEVNDRNCFRMIAKGRSQGITDVLYKVRDKYESYVDKESIIPLKSIRDIREGDYKSYDEITYNPFTDTITSQLYGKKQMPDNIQDLLSAFYFARCYVFANAKPGDTLVINTFFDGELFPMVVRYAGKEKVETDLGIFNCLKLFPLVEEGRVFKSKEDVRIWVTDDKSFIPVRIQSDIIVGSVKFDLVEYSGLRNRLINLED